jgi:hypothetical protein
MKLIKKAQCGWMLISAKLKKEAMQQARLRE